MDYEWERNTEGQRGVAKCCFAHKETNKDLRTRQKEYYHDQHKEFGTHLKCELNYEYTMSSDCPEKLKQVLQSFSCALSLLSCNERFCTDPRVGGEVEQHGSISYIFSQSSVYFVGFSAFVLNLSLSLIHI